MPNRFFGPLHAINLHTIWLIVILMMTISAAGYIAIRLMGPQFGLPLSGLASGFVSSAATIAAMGARASQQPVLSRAAVAGAVLSTVATILELGIVLGATSRVTLVTLAVPLTAAGIAALLYGIAFTLRSFRSDPTMAIERGRAFSIKTAVLFAITIALMLLVSAVLHSLFGERGLLVAAAAAGFADTHSSAVSVASLVSAGAPLTSRMPPSRFWPASLPTH